MEVNTKIIDEVDGEIHLNINASKEFVQEQFKNVVSDIAKNVKMDGFRKGKVPHNIVRQKYADYVKEDAFSTVVERSILEGLKKEELPMTRNIEIVSKDLQENFGEDQPFEIEVKVIRPPSVELGNYKDLEVDVTEYYFEDDRIDSELTKIAKERASFVEKEENEPIVDGDLVSFKGCYYLVGKDDDDLENMFIVAGKQNREEEKQAIADAVIGMTLGDEKEIPITIPDNHKNEDLRNRNGNLYVKIENVKTLKIPELNDDFAKDIGFTHLDELKEKIKEELEKDIEEKNKKNKAEAVYDKVIEESEFQISPKLIEKEALSRIEEVKKDMKEKNYDIQEFLDYHKLENEQAYQEMLKETLLKDYKRLLVIFEIVKLEEFNVTRKDIEKRITKAAKASGQNPFKVLKDVEKDEDLQRRIEEDIVFEWVEDFLLKNNKIQETKRELLPE